MLTQPRGVGRIDGPTEASAPPGPFRTRPARAAPVGDAGRAAIDEARSSACWEIVTVMPGGGTTAQELRQSREEDIALLLRGARGCLLTETAAFGDADIRVELEARMERGAHVRLVRGHLQRMLLVDRRVAVVPMDPGLPADGSMAVLDHPLTVRNLWSMFAQLWREATSAPHHLTRERASAADHRDLLNLMKDGATDDSGARRMGVSIRTYRRYVAGLMNDLDAGSRFQAGVQAAARGWVR